MDATPGTRRASDAVNSDRPFRILVLGDFSGRSNRGQSAPLADRKPVLVDRDNFDEVLAAMRPRLSLAGSDLEFTELDDFHPDHLYARLDLFRKLADDKQKPLAPVAGKETHRSAASPGNLLDAMIEEADEEPEPPAVEAAGDLAGFLKKITAPHLVAREDPRQAEQSARADSTAAAALRALLHHPDFQALEAAWRGLSLLARGLDTDGDLKLYVCDATLRELAGDSHGVQRVFTGGDDGWAVIAGSYVFEPSEAYANLLSDLGQRARTAGAPFIAEGSPPPDQLDAQWAALRRSPEARWIGLVLPRFLLRLPYGPKTSPVESFDFDEMPVSIHQDYLWGNPAFACALLLGQTFLSDGWEMRPGTRRRIEGLPVHVYREDGESRMKPCAEVSMTENEAEYLMERGIMPLASIEDQDAVMLVRFQSLAEPPTALPGPWE